MSNALLKLDRTAQAEVEDLLARLEATRSINPWISPGAPGEGEVADLISSRPRELDGVEVTVEEVLPGRSNVLARMPHLGRGTPRLQRPHRHRRLRGMAGPCADANP